MTRVSEHSSNDALKYALNRSKQRMEDLQLKGSTLRAITKPSDNPVSNVEALAINSSTSDNIQYLKNSDFALTYLNVTEKSLEELTEILSKAKEIAIAQSSDFFNADVRKSVSTEIQQLYNQTLSIANRKVGLKHIFSGHNTLKTPFDANGEYFGDDGKTTLEIAKNFYVPINLHGKEVFYSLEETPSVPHPLEEFEQFDTPNKSKKEFDLKNKRNLANATTPNEKIKDDGFRSRDNIFSQLKSLTNALENNDSKTIQTLLEHLDNSMSRLITLRTRVGSLTNSIATSRSMIEAENIDQATRKSSLIDADVAELFSDIQKHQALLKTTYQSSQSALNYTLLDFLRR